MKEQVPDVLVVGAGSAGAALAARLSEDPDRRVLLVDEGPDHEAGAWPERVRDPSTLPSPTLDRGWTRWVEVVLHDDRRTVVPRGRTVGGSSAVNGTYFVRGTVADFDAWAARGGPGWAFEAVLPAFRRLESDLDLGDRPWHGDDGPVPVSRPAAGAIHPVTEGFLAAAAAHAHPAVADLNEPGACGAGLVPCNIAGGERVNVGMAYLDARRDRPNLTVRGGVRVRRVVIERGRAIGVEVDAGRTSRILRAGHVVLSAGAVATAQLLMLSGIGPAEELLAQGIDVVVDAPGVGRVRDHPAIDLMWEPRSALPPAPAGPAFHAALHLSSGVAGDDDLELLAMVRPYGLSDGSDPDDTARSLRVGIQRCARPGTVRLASAAPHAPPVVELGYLADAEDRARAREGVRRAVELLESAEMRAAVGAVTLRAAPSPRELADDDELDRWVREHLGTSMHSSGTAAMGPEGDPSAVVDERCRVRGVEGLLVADTSIVPVPLSRGPAATAVMIGERVAELYPEG